MSKHLDRTSDAEAKLKFVEVDHGEEKGARS